MKLGLVIEGGGMKCAYTAGILDRMLEDEIQPEVVTGVSAGAACGASFVAGQYDRNRRFFVEYVSDPEYMGWESYRHTGNFFNLDYIYMDITAQGGRDPIDYEALMKNETKLLVGATDALSAEEAYFGKEDVTPEDYTIFKATCAIPVACRPVKKNSRLYYDGGVADPIPVKRTLMEGCDKVIILLCRPKSIIRGPQNHRRIYRAALRNYPRMIHAIDVRHLRYNATLHAALELEKKGHALILAPHEQIDISTYTKDRDVLQGVYDRAVEEYNEDREKLMAFLK